MPSFSYKARDSEGKLVTGRLEAESQRAVVDVLDGRGLFAVDVRPVEPLQGRALLARRRGVSLGELVQTFRSLADLVRAGVPLSRALAILHRQSKRPPLQQLLGDLHQHLLGGSSLADAMASQPRVFDRLQIAMVRAGETGGFLEDVLQRIAEFGDHRQAIRRQVVSSLAYPALLVCAVFGAVVFLLSYVVPKFTEIFAAYDQQALPLPTRMLLWVSGWLGSYWPVLVFVLLLGLFVVVQGGGSPRGRLFIDSLKLRLPVFRTAVAKLAVARFCRTLGTLLAAGVPIIEALSIARHAVGNVIYEQAIDSAIPAVREGSSLAEALAKENVFDDTLIEMISVSEAAGNTDGVLLDVAGRYETQARSAIEITVRLLEPVVIIFMAAVVFIVVASIILPLSKLYTLPM